MKVYKFHTDPGHGWCAVKIEELKDLQIEDKISSCSFINGQTAYLEEDCDFAVFHEAKEKNGEKFRRDWDVEESYKEYTPIRNYKRYDLNQKVEV